MMVTRFKIYCTLFYFIFYSFVAGAVNPVTVKKETSLYVINVQYPQGFQDSRVNAVVQEFIEKTKKDFLQEMTNNIEMPASVPGKSGLNMTYSLPLSHIPALLRSQMLHSVWGH